MYRTPETTQHGVSAPGTHGAGITTARLIRWSGAAALLAGVLFAGIQPIHPPDILASVTTSAWAVMMLVKLAMCMAFLLGITGLYARQANAVGWLGLLGFLLFSLSWSLNLAFIFAEAFILPVLAGPAPQFVESVLSIINGQPATMDIGALPGIYAASGICFLLGGLLFGIASFRASILPRSAGALLALSAALTPVAGLLPHTYQRFAGIPVGIAVAWLGLALLLERREHVDNFGRSN